MWIFKATYIGSDETSLKTGEVYGVERSIVKSDGKVMFLLEGVNGEYDRNLFRVLENKGFHYLANKGVPTVGNYLRLVKRRNDISELMTDKVKVVEKSVIPGVYKVCTNNAMYEVSTLA